MLNRQGQVKIMDFGLAQLADRTRLTETATRIGTPAYMSPEQVQGKPADRRTDIWSLGVVLYEMVSGQLPFEGEREQAVVYAIANQEPEPMTALRAGVPMELDRIVGKALAKNPAERYAHSDDLLVDLRAVRKRLESGPSRPAAREAVQSRSSRAGWYVAAAAVAVIVAGAAWFRFFSPPAAPPPRLEYTQLTNFADSAVAPALSPDGRILAFIRSENTFEGPGEVYVKLLPGGEPVQVTHDGKRREGPVVFSPDGSLIGFTVGGSNGDTWTAPVLGGEPALLLARSSGLSWIEPAPGQRRVMFSALTGEGIHMGIVESTESRSEVRTIYLPANKSGMAHRSFLSPDHRQVLVVEMDLGSWLPCRLVPFDGSDAGTRVGPQPAQCTDAAWSPDGKWMYLSANTGDGFHIWRQRFPDGVPEQVTSGATEEQGISFAPDGRSFVTSVGSSLSTLWVHDASGDRQITSEGFTFLPSFSPDGKTLYYLVRSRASRRFVSGELWAASLETGRTTRLLPDFLMEHYNVSSDGKQVVFLSIDEAGHSPVWLAPLDGSAPPRRLASQEYSARAMFDPHGGVLFVGGDRGVAFLYHVNLDGSGLRKLFSTPVSFLYAVSPDGRALAVWVGVDVYVYFSDGGTPTLICSKCGTAGEENRGVTPPLLSWSPDEKFLYMHNVRDRQTFAVPLRPGQLLPPLPADGLRGLFEAASLPGAQAIPQPRAYGGAAPSTYAFPRVTTHRNIYSIPVR